MNDKRCYELRIYTAGEGKLDALNARFRNHTLGLFKKHGMTSVGYWMPSEKENPDRKLYYVLSYPSREFRDAAFKAFGADPEWQAVYKESEKDGRLAIKVESQFLHMLDFSPKLPAKSARQPRAFELRTYYASPGNLARLQNRFRQHTVKLFEKHKMTNIAYWELDADQKGADNTLIYLMAYPNEMARKASWDSFRTDPAWLAAREASEKDAGGALTLKEKGVLSLPLLPTDYSPLI